MKTDTPKTLADFAPALHQALLSLTHPMASEDDLHDAIELLDEIKAARKAACDAAFVKAASVRASYRRAGSGSLAGTKK